MCGIAGLVNLTDRHEPPPAELLRRMARAIRHRGPDEFGYYRDARAGLCHARLSIIDLATGQQPLANEDETVWIVFNGEVFNYVELREELEALGHRFRTHSDTEVIVHAWEAWGEDAFARFNGQWAVALWDTKSQRLVLTRDRVGVRPLYLHERDGRLWFGSEVKALFADPTVPRALDPAGLDETFTFWAAVAPRTVYRGVEELRPGAVRVYERDGSRRERLYWQPTYPRCFPRAEREPYPLSLDEATEALEAHLTRATQLRMLRADVPVGSYLSGGLDSSLTAHLGRQAKEGEFRTFSLRFEDAEYDETKYQRMMSERLHSSHAEVVVSRADIARAFKDVVRFTERPILRTAPAPLYLLSKLVRDSGFKVVLTGEGADEMLAGYDLFREARIRRFWARHPDSKLRPRLFDRLYPYLARSPQQARGMALQFWARGLEKASEPGFSHDPRWTSTGALKRFFTQELRDQVGRDCVAELTGELPSGFKGWDPLAQAQYLEVITLLSSYLLSSQGDRMLMANSVEGRFPFLDKDVMDFCNGLPASYKLAVLDEKHLLKRVARGKLPPDIVSRPKQPYRAPDALSFIAEGAPEYIAESFSEAALADAGVFNVRAARTLYEKCVRRGRDPGGAEQFSNADNMAFVGILSTQLVHHWLIRGDGDIPGGDVPFRTVIDRVG
ncbi:MAG: asparagine synthase (glutamine-hydrolyzing) [Deltaproteobacteria bacterium]|nr:asparagine synthase (glutamine-hydrolyzing) [Deltaproteobacteria bacterium]